MQAWLPLVVVLSTILLCWGGLALLLAHLDNRPAEPEEFP